MLRMSCSSYIWQQETRRGEKGCKDANGDQKKKKGVETHLPSYARPCEQGGVVMERCVGGGGDCKAEMGGLLISTMQYHAAGGSKARGLAVMKMARVED